MNRKLFIGAIIGSVVLGGALIVGANDSITEDTKKNIISYHEAEEKALQEVSGKVEGIDLEKENGKIVYEVVIADQEDDKNVYIDGKSGEIIAVTDDDDDKGFFQSENTSMNTEVISLEEAIKIAEKAVSGKSYSVEREYDDGRIKYEVELKTSRGEVDVEIDGKTGKVIEIDYED